MARLIEGFGERSLMTRDVIHRVAFAIQDESMTRLEALRYARAALGALQAGDRFNGMVVRLRKEDPDIRRPFVVALQDHSPEI